MPVEQFLEQRPELVDAISNLDDGQLAARVTIVGDKIIKSLQVHSPEVVEWVEGLTDAEVTDMLQAMDAMAAYPEINRTLH